MTQPTSFPDALDTPAVMDGDDFSGDPRVLAREFFASALYVAIVLLTALVALPKDRLPADRSVVATMLGTSIGLVIAHFVAFRVAAHLTAESGVAPEDVAKEAGAGLAGGLAVALLASLPYAVLDGDNALIATLMALAFLPALMGLAIARLRGRSWLSSIIASAIFLGLALVVVLIKYELGH